MSTILTFDIQIDSGASSSSYSTKTIKKNIEVEEYVLMSSVPVTSTPAYVYPGFPLVSGRTTTGTIDLTAGEWDSCGFILKNTGAQTVNLEFLNSGPGTALDTSFVPPLSSVIVPANYIVSAPAIVCSFKNSSTGAITTYAAKLSTSSLTSTVDIMFWRK